MDQSVLMRRPRTTPSRAEPRNPAHSTRAISGSLVTSPVRVPAGSVSVQGGGGRYGMLGTTVINDEVTEVVDIGAITSAVDESYFRAETLTMV
mgnify:CR=1 FL=1